MHNVACAVQMSTEPLGNCFVQHFSRWKATVTIYLILHCGEVASLRCVRINAYLHESGMNYVLHYRRLIAIGRKLAAENHGGPS
jgi:hypothetical protein